MRTCVWFIVLCLIISFSSSSSPSPFLPNDHVDYQKESTLCFNKKEILFRNVHIPKTGGSSLECSFSQRKALLNPCLNQLNNKDMKYELLGVHENYQEVVQNIMNCSGDYEKNGINCANRSPSRCEPFITFLAHPADRFLSAFYQLFQLKSKDRMCNMVQCRENSKIAELYSNHEITPSEFALWKIKSDISQSFNVQVRYLSSQVPSSSQSLQSSRKMRIPIINNTQGLKLLEIAKTRINKMDFIGISKYFMFSLEMMSWKLGIPIYHTCNCNLNLYRNQTNSKFILSKEAKKQIIQDNSLDFELYNYALSLFYKNLQIYIHFLKKQNNINIKNYDFLSQQIYNQIHHIDNDNDKIENNNKIQKLNKKQKKIKKSKYIKDIKEIKKNNQKNEQIITTTLTTTNNNNNNNNGILDSQLMFQRNSFSSSFQCNFDQILCKGHGERKHKFIPSQKYEELYERYIRIGRSTNCAYQCQRNDSFH